MALVSVVVPVYKVEQFLPECIESVLAQTLTDWELILVDDGSPDRCGEICDSYAEKYPKIRVLHQENSGQTGARKTGAEIATGKYLSFIDSDDFLEPDYYERLVAQAESQQADMVICGYTTDFADRSELGENALASGVYQGTSLEKLRNDAIFYIPKAKSGITGAMWCKLFLREMAREPFLKQEQILRIGEDMLFSYTMLMNAKIVAIDNENHGYHYRIHSGSITQGYYGDYFRDLHLLYDSLRSVAQTHGGGNPCALSHYYVYLYTEGVYHELARDHQANVKQRLSAICRCAKDERLGVCLKDVDLRQLPSGVRIATGYLGKGKPYRFLAAYLMRAVSSKLTGRHEK